MLVSKLKKKSKKKENSMENGKCIRNIASSICNKIFVAYIEYNNGNNIMAKREIERIFEWISYECIYWDMLQNDNQNVNYHLKYK